MKTKITKIATGFMIALSLITILTSAKAQDYKNAIGIRGAYAFGLTFKHFIHESAAIEAILSTNYYRYGGGNLTLLYEKHKYAFGTKEFRWFYGAGAHIGTFNGNNYWYDHDHEHYYDHYYADNRQLINFGIDGILGLEYKITEIPFTIGVDLKPYIDLNYFGPGFIDGALTVRYYW